MVKQKKRTCITQSGKNYAINCAIQDVSLIWKQKIWLAICEFLWSLTNQNAWCLTSFCTELIRFCTVFKKRTALLLTNQNGDIFLRILLVINQPWQPPWYNIGHQNFADISSVDSCSFTRRRANARSISFVYLLVVVTGHLSPRSTPNLRIFLTHRHGTRFSLESKTFVPWLRAKTMLTFRALTLAHLLDEEPTLEASALFISLWW